MISYLIKLFNFGFQKINVVRFHVYSFLMPDHKYVNIHDNLTTRRTIKRLCHVKGNTKKPMQLIK